MTKTDGYHFNAEVIWIDLVSIKPKRFESWKTWFLVVL